MFEALLQWLTSRGYLKDTRINADEKLLTFLRMAATSMSYRALQEEVQHSKATLSSIMHEVIFGLLKLHEEVVLLPNERSPVPSWIEDEPKFAKYFKDCVGAIDRSHIAAHVVGEEQDSYRCRKGYPSQNVLAICDFDGQFTYVYAGWEGSAHNMRVFDAAKEDGLTCPAGRYFLTDAGYSNSDMTLVPYRGTRYHLKEWEKSAQRPGSKEELFNLRHSSLRNAIERIFGVLKGRWQVLNKRPRYSLKFQKELVYALTAVNNFIKQHGQEDIVIRRRDLEVTRENNYDSNNAVVEDRESTPMAERREAIAEAMWKDY